MNRSLNMNTVHVTNLVAQRAFRSPHVWLQKFVLRFIVYIPEKKYLTSTLSSCKLVKDPIFL